MLLLRLEFVLGWLYQWDALVVWVADTAYTTWAYV